MANLSSKKMNCFLFFLSTLLIISLSFNLMNGIKSYSFQKASERVYSHRGASGEELEHSFAAYDLAIQYGSKYIEQDVVTSKDGTLFISHDQSTKKITDIDKLFKEMNDSEIEKIKKTDGSPFLKLQDVFDRYKKQGNYVIELKEGHQQTDSFIDIIKKNDMQDNTIIQSTDMSPLDKVAVVFPKMKKLLLVKNQSELEKEIRYKNVDIVSANKSLMTKSNLKLVHNLKKEFNVWTLNSAEEIIEAINLNTDSYFTEYTAKAFTLETLYRK